MKRNLSLSRWLPRLIAFFLPIIVGSTTFFLVQFIQKNQAFPPAPVVVYVPTVSPSVIPQTKQQPTSIYIPKINRRLPIQAAVVWGNNWQMFDSAVAWLSTSAVPGEGNVVLYAHNKKPLWGDLYKLQVGDRVEVEQNGNIRMYTVTESKAVTPKDIDAIRSTEDQLTMYTCEGTFDQKRRVVYAHPTTTL